MCRYCWTLCPERGRKRDFKFIDYRSGYRNCWTLCPERGRKLPASVALVHPHSTNCWTLYPERGRKQAKQPTNANHATGEDCWTLYPERGRKHVGGVPIGKVAELLDSSPPPPRGDGNRLAIGHKGVGRERVVGLFTSKRSRISTAAPSRNFYSTSDSCRTTVRRRPRGSCRGAPRIRGDDPR